MMSIRHPKRYRRRACQSFSPNEFATGDNSLFKINPLRRTYDWTLSWANRPAGAWALFVLSFAESSVFPIPPDALLIPLALGKPLKSFRYALNCSVASVLGGAFGYLIGYEFWQLTHNFFFKYVFSEATFNRVAFHYNAHAFLAVFGAAFGPIPYKVFTIAAGVCKINFLQFMIASALGRSGRFFVEATIIRFFGNQAKIFIDKYFNWLALAFFALLIFGFWALSKLV